MSKPQYNSKFVGIPTKTMLSEQWLNFSPSTRCVYQTMLLKYKQKDGDHRVRWKQEEIAEAGRLSLNTVKRGLNVLKENKWVSIWEPGGRWLDGTTYEIDPKWARW